MKPASYFTLKLTKTIDRIQILCYIIHNFITQMKKKDGKKQGKKQQQQRQMQQEKERQQRQQMEAKKQSQLQQRSLPLVQYGLLDAFQFFMVQLTQAGIPQTNVFEFAAQMVLKYQKIMRKKNKHLHEINNFNQSTIKNSPTKQPKKLSPPKVRDKSPPVKMPFKAELTQQQKAILNNLAIKK